MVTLKTNRCHDAYFRNFICGGRRLTIVLSFWIIGFLIRARDYLCTEMDPRWFIQKLFRNYDLASCLNESVQVWRPIYSSDMMT